MYFVARSHLHLGNLNGMEQTVEKILKAEPNYYEVYQIACLYSVAGESAKALDALEQGFKKGFDTYDWILVDEDLDNIRDLPEFKALMKKYFPDWVKE